MKATETKNHPEKIKAVIQEFNGGKYGKMGEYVAIVKPQYFKNGNMKKSGFTVDKIIETRKKGYGYSGCAHAERIAKVLEIIE